MPSYVGLGFRLLNINGKSVLQTGSVGFEKNGGFLSQGNECLMKETTELHYEDGGSSRAEP